MKKIVIYHRASSIDTDEEIKDKINSILVLAPPQCDMKVIWERADNFLAQYEFDDLIRGIKSGGMEVHEIIAYSLNTLVNSNYFTAMERLEEIVIKLKVDVRFYNANSNEVAVALYLWKKFNEDRVIERNQLSAARMRENGTLVGARPKYIDVDLAVGMRREGKTYKEIAERLDCSVMHVFRNMPLHLRGCLDDKTKRRMQKLRERIEAKTRELREKENGANETRID